MASISSTKSNWGNPNGVTVAPKDQVNQLKPRDSQEIKFMTGMVVDDENIWSHTKSVLVVPVPLTALGVAVAVVVTAVDLLAPSTFTNVERKGDSKGEIKTGIKTTETTEVDSKSGEVEEDGKKLPPIASFDDMGLTDELLRGIYAYGLEKPSTIQQVGIPNIMTGRDTIAQAESGTGKTGTFAIACLQRVDSKIKACQILIIEPTIELARQTEQVIRCLGDHVQPTTHLCVGGTLVRTDIVAVRKGVQIVVGTVGRITHLIRCKALDLTNLKMFVLDEADELLDDGFRGAISDIYQKLPYPTPQIVLVSATLPQSVLTLTKEMMRNPIRIIRKEVDVTLDGIKQFYVDVKHEKWKLETLFDLYDSMTITGCIIYANTRGKVEWLAKEMDARDHSVGMIHSDMSKQDREMAITAFRSGSTRVLVTTDLLARGIDIQTVSLVINYDLPIKKETYVHRIGRSGRFGRKGTAINFVTEDERDVQMMADICKLYNTQINEIPKDPKDMEA